MANFIPQETSTPKKPVNQPIEDLRDAFEKKLILQDQIEELQDKLKKSEDKLKKSEDKLKKSEDKCNNLEVELQTLEDENSYYKEELESYLALQTSRDCSQLDDDSASAPADASASRTEADSNNSANSSTLSLKESSRLVSASSSTTVLYCTCDGKTNHYFSIEHDKHAEINMLEKMKEMKAHPIEIWISYSPCSDCAKKLLDYYRDQKDKPSIRVKKIYVGASQPHDGCGNKNHRGLAALIREGFNVNILDTTHYEKFIKEQDKRLQLCKNFADKVVKRAFKDYSKEYFESLDSLWKPGCGIVANLIIMECQRQRQKNRCVLLTLFSNGTKEIVEPLTESKIEDWYERFKERPFWKTKHCSIVLNYYFEDKSFEGLKTRLKDLLKRHSIKTTILEETDKTTKEKKSDIPLLTTEEVVEKFQRGDANVFENLVWKPDNKEYQYERLDAQRQQ